MMKIGLLAVDSKYPNLALMKISAYHKAQVDTVEWYNQFDTYNRLYMAKCFRSRLIIPITSPMFVSRSFAVEPDTTFILFFLIVWMACSPTTRSILVLPITWLTVFLLVAVLIIVAGVSFHKSRVAYVRTWTSTTSRYTAHVITQF